MPRPPPRIRDARAGRARPAAAPRDRPPVLRVTPCFLRAPLYGASGRGVKRPRHGDREGAIRPRVIAYCSGMSSAPPPPPPPSPPPRLSKSRYLSGLQCHKQLWWRVHDPDAPELSPSAGQQNRLAPGGEGGVRAPPPLRGGPPPPARAGRAADRPAVLSARQHGSRHPRGSATRRAGDLRGLVSGGRHLRDRKSTRLNSSH